MSYREFFKLFIPPFLLVLKNFFFKKKDKLEKSPLPQIEHGSDKIVILGNGPSLLDSISQYKAEILENDKIVVNFFASSDLYEVVRPNIYVFADPAFFSVPEELKDSINKLLQDIKRKTTWPIKFFIPSTARNAVLIPLLQENKYISINFYFSGWQDIGKKTKFEAWDENLIHPPAQNVLNVAIYLALYWGYKETYLIGADSSFLEDLRVDQNTNELFTIDRHFYDNKKVYSDKKLIESKRGRVMNNWTLHDLIHAYGRMFEHYYELKQYADYKGLKVYNASEYSWINVFERRKLR